MLLALASAAVLLTTSGEAVRVRASQAAAPCVAAALRAWPRQASAVAVTEGALSGPGFEVLVGSAKEITSAIETGLAAEGSDQDVARIPWVLTVPKGNPEGIRGLADLSRTRQDIAVLEGAEGYEAQRALRAVVGGRTRELSGKSALSGAGSALLPLSLAGGERVTTDVPPLVVRIALVGEKPRQAARSFLGFLSSSDGQAAFVACKAATRP